MMKELKKAIEAIENVGLDDLDASEIIDSLIKKVIDANVTFLDWKQREIVARLPMVGEWATIYRKNQGEGHVDFEKWLIVDIKTFHDFIMEHFAECKGLGLPWPHKRLVVIRVEHDSFHHSSETRRKIALARVAFIEEWLAKN